MGIFYLARLELDLYDQTEDFYVGFLQVKDKRLMHRIGRLRHKGNYIAGTGKTLECCILIVDQNGRYLTILHNILSANDNNIAVINADCVHAVTAHAQSKVFRTAVEIGERVALDVLLCVDRRTGRDTAKNGDGALGERSQPERHCREVCLFVP